MADFQALLTKLSMVSAWPAAVHFSQASDTACWYVDWNKRQQKLG